MRVQVHTFDVQEVAVHEQGNLARATYRLHLSVLRDGQVAFGFVATQNLALARTGRQWRISGGDQAQLSDVIGEWPLPRRQSSN
jgi:ketosteroid isomerase-like protein